MCDEPDVNEGQLSGPCITTRPIMASADGAAAVSPVAVVHVAGAAAPLNAAASFGVGAVSASVARGAADDSDDDMEAADPMVDQPPALPGVETSEGITGSGAGAALRRSRRSRKMTFRAKETAQLAVEALEKRRPIDLASTGLGQNAARVYSQLACQRPSSGAGKVPLKMGCGAVLVRWVEKYLAAFEVRSRWTSAQHCLLGDRTTSSSPAPLPLLLATDTESDNYGKENIQSHLKRHCQWPLCDHPRAWWRSCCLGGRQPLCCPRSV